MEWDSLWVCQEGKVLKWWVLKVEVGVDQREWMQVREWEVLVFAETCCRYCRCKSLHGHAKTMLEVDSIVRIIHEAEAVTRTYV